MFRKSRTDHKQDAKASVQDAAAAAQHHLRETVAPVVAAKAHDAKEWATPKVERGLEAAAPKVEAAVEKISPAVDAARDKLVDDLLPRLVDAVNAAAAAGATAAAAGAAAKSRSGDAVAVLKGEAVAKRPHRKRKFFLLTALVAAVGAALAVFKKQQPKDDPWAVPAGTYPTTSTFTSDTSSPSATEGAGSTGTTATAATDAALDSGAAGDVLDDGAGEAEVPGLTADSAAAAEAITDAAEDTSTGGSAKKQGDPLTDPIDQVENADKP